MDRISELPQPIQHDILCFLSPREASQTCVLSKSWRDLWRTGSVVEFDENLFGDNKLSFLLTLCETLERYYLENLCIKRFVVEALSDAFELLLIFEIWFPKLTNLGVETLHIILNERNPSALPFTFHAEFLKELRLWRCKIESIDDHQQLCLNHLKTLSLIWVDIEDETLQKVMESCPLLESVDLRYCLDLITVKVDNHNLKSFGCLSSSKKVEIKVPSALEIIKIESCLNLLLYHINNHHFPHLKSLYLSSVQLSKEFSNIFSCTTPCLEHLDLRFCRGFNHVKISSRSLKSLIIKDFADEIKIISIDAPTILYFEFERRSSVPSISFATVAPSREWESNIYLFDPPPFIKLHEFVKALRQSRLTIDFSDTIVKEHLKDTNHHLDYHEPVAVENLDLGGYVSFDEFLAIFNSLFRFIRPRCINMTCRVYNDPQGMQSLEDSINKLVEYMAKTNLKDGEWFWQPELKEFRLEHLDHDSKKWCLVQGSWLPVVASPDYPASHNIRFVFDWRSSVMMLA